MSAEQLLLKSLSKITTGTDQGKSKGHIEKTPKPWAGSSRHPFQIVFEHILQSNALDAAIRKEAQRLERFYDPITSARVVIARP
jgi:hypothetical protein